MHIIQKLTVEINAPNQAVGEEIVNNIGDFIKTKVLPQLEAYFDQIDTGDLLKIEELALDLGTVSLSGFPQNILGEFEQKLEHTLKEEITKRSAGTTEERDWESLGKEASPPAQNQTLKVEKQGKNKQLLAIFFYFLEHGIFPWWAHEIKQLYQLETAILLELEQQNSLQIRTLLLQEIKQNPRRIDRFLFQFSENLLFPKDQLLQDLNEGKILGGNRDAARPSIAGKAVQTENPKFHIQQIHQEIQRIISKILKQNTNKSHLGQQLQKTIIEAIPTANPIVNFKQMQEIVQRYIKRVFEEETDEIDRLKISQLFEKKNAHSIIGKEVVRFLQSTNEAQVLTTKEQEVPPVITASQIPKEIYLPHAGIVLIHAMLPPFFQRLGLVTSTSVDDLQHMVTGSLPKKQFKDKTAQTQAIYLLHLLATEAENPGEEQLFLYKLLCGFPLDEVIAPALPFTEKTKEECEKMLAAAISYWKIMPNTSPRSLRGAFLQRPGKLSKNDDGWLLQLESAAHDIILDHAPWGLGLVRYSWMEGTLLVEW